VILALDSSTESGSAALLEAGHLLREVTFAGGRNKGGGAAAALEELAISAEIIDVVVVGTGPGSYNGIRSAVAVAWGFAKARGATLHGVSSLLALAPGEYLAAGDARQSQYYFAHIRDGKFVVEPTLLTSETLQEAVNAHPDLPVFSPAPLDLLPDAVVAGPRATLLAGFAPTEADPPPPGIPLPLYLKPPHITKPRGS
jgi:tRNA threonylcarbamoyl adenosine modification protein YeaZ